MKLKPLSVAFSGFIVFLCCASMQSHAYDRNQLSQWLQEQQYARVLALAQSVPAPEQDIFLWNTAGYAAYQNGSNAVALQFWRQTLDSQKTNAQALLYSGIINKAETRYQPAIRYFSRLIESTPSNIRAYQLMAECFSALKQPDSARLILAQGNAVDPTSPKLAAAYADALMDNKEFAAADAALESALRSDSASTLVLGALVKSAHLQHKYWQTLTLCLKYLTTGTISYTPVLYGLMAALRLNNFTQCLSLCQTLLATGNETEQVLYYASKAYAGLKDYDASNLMLRRCLDKSISENAAVYYGDLAENAEAAGRPARAVPFYDTAYYLFKDPAQLYAKGRLLERAGNKAAAGKVYSQYLTAPASRQDTAVMRYVRGYLGK